MPSVTEQERIVAHIAVETEPLGVATVRFEREIELLREYRARLVAKLVTGKLDVREVAQRLPEEGGLDVAGEPADLGDEAEAADEEAAV